MTAPGMPHHLASPTAGTALDRSPGHARPGTTLAVVCLAQFMVLLDVSVVNVALPSIGHDLHYGDSELQWVINAYTIAFAGCLLLGGRLADSLGHRRVFLLGLCLFAGASLFGGLAQNSTELTMARCLQGVGGAVLSPATLTIVTATFDPGPRRQKALAIWNAVGGAGGALGGLAGGVITGYLGWRWVLIINVPVAVLAGVAAGFTLRSATTGEDQQVDALGAVAATGGLASLTYGLIGTTAHGWLSPQTLGYALLGLALLAAFVARQRQQGERALLPLSLLRGRQLAVANAVMTLAGATFFSMWYFLSLYFQRVLGYTPLTTGLLFLPMGAGIIIGSILSARLAVAAGVRRVAVLGLLLASAGFVALTQLSADRADALIAVLGGVAAAAGVGVSFPPLTAAATSAAIMGRAGLVSGLLNTSRQVGGSLGLAVMTTVAASFGLDAAFGAPNSDANAARGIAAAFVVATALAAAAALLSGCLPGPSGDSWGSDVLADAPPA